MVKEKEPGLRISILNEDGEVNEDLTEAFANFMPKGKKLGVEMSSELIVEIATAVVKQFTNRTDDLTIKTDGVVINPVNFSDRASRFKCEIVMVPE